MSSANQFLKSLNSKFEKGVGASGGAPEVREDRVKIDKLSKLEELKAADKTIKCFIDKIGEDGTISHIDKDGVTYFLTSERITQLYPDYNPRYSGYLLGSSFDGKIGEIDKENKTVELVDIANGSMKNAVFSRLTKAVRVSNSAQAFKGLLNSTIGKEKKTGAKVRVKGIVKEVKWCVTYIDMYGTGVIGAVPSRLFRQGYTSDMTTLVSVGDVLEGVVIGYGVPVKGEPEAYIVNTAAYTVYNTKKYLDKVKVGDALVVHCVKKPRKEGREFFWGQCSYFPGIDIMCDYSTSVPKESVHLTEYFSVRIKKVAYDEASSSLKIAAIAFHKVEKDETTD